MFTRFFVVNSRWQEADLQARLCMRWPDIYCLFFQWRYSKIDKNRVGPLTISEIGHFNFDFTFIGCPGADIEGKRQRSWLRNA